jgi:integrase/recombinase XerD
MLVRYFRRPSRIEQLRSSTGGHLLEGFAKELSQGCYQWVAARKHIRAAEHFLHWISHRNLSIMSVEERYAQQFLDHLKRCRCRGHHPPLKPHRQKYSVDLWFDYLRRVGIVPTPTFVEPAVEAPMLTSFCDWMRRQRGVSDATLSIYRFELRAFIKDLGEDPHMYDARNLRQFVLDKSQHSGWASARKCICAVRMFLRFLISQGRCPDYLYASIPTFAHWRLSALPFYLQADQVEQVIASPDLATSLGRRNRAILLLLARLGLRASDIVQLRLDDLDWKEGMIRVSGKGRRQTVLPLTQEVGDALARIIHERH